MKRRAFITLLGAAAAWPLAARAQQPSKLPMIGVIGGGTPSTHGQWIAGFVQRLRELGWIEDRTVAIEIRNTSWHHTAPTQTKGVCEPLLMLIERVAAALSERGELSGDEVDALLGDVA